MSMYLLKVISKIFVDVLKVTDENSRIRIRVRIQIHKSEVWIRGSGSVPKFHGFATLVKGTVVERGHSRVQSCANIKYR